MSTCSDLLIIETRVLKFFPPINAQLTLTVNLMKIAFHESDEQLINLSKKVDKIYFHFFKFYY